MISIRSARAGLSFRLRAGAIPTSTSGRSSRIFEPIGNVQRFASLTATREPFPIVMMGSGNVMFGTNDGPWNHSLRLERKLGQRLQVAAIVDPNIQRAHEVLSRKLASPDTAPNYANAQICGNISDLPSTQPPRLVVIGTHPCSRGMDVPGRDLELQVMRHFPGVPLFVEKPVSTGDVPAARRVAHTLSENGVMCSVGYMLRYLKAVQRMKQIIQDNNLVVMGTNSRYYGAYANGARLDWWDKSREQGPIVEQATHFCDLARYFAGDVDLGTVAARTVEWHERPGKLARLPIDESNLIAPENRIPRSTSAIWKYTSGAIGSMTHSTILQGTKYACEFEVYCDGHTMRLSDPYGVPVLSVRRAGQDDEDVERYEDDDPFYSEVSNLIDMIERVEGRGPSMLSTYQDACRSYELTWAIREASERASVKPE